MRNKKDLIKYYENKLIKVKVAYSNNGYSLNEKNDEYIEFAEKELEAVKNGRCW